MKFAKFCFMVPLSIVGHLKTSLLPEDHQDSFTVVFQEHSLILRTIHMSGIEDACVRIYEIVSREISSLASSLER